MSRSKAVFAVVAVMLVLTFNLETAEAGLNISRVSMLIRKEIT